MYNLFIDFIFICIFLFCLCAFAYWTVVLPVALLPCAQLFLVALACAPLVLPGPWPTQHQGTEGRTAKARLLKFTCCPLRLSNGRTATARKARLARANRKSTGSSWTPQGGLLVSIVFLSDNTGNRGSKCIFIFWIFN
jgi:hypothetical protein